MISKSVLLYFGTSCPFMSPISSFSDCICPLQPTPIPILMKLDTSVDRSLIERWWSLIIILLMNLYIFFFFLPTRNFLNSISCFFSTCKCTKSTSCYFYQPQSVPFLLFWEIPSNFLSRLISSSSLRRAPDVLTFSPQLTRRLLNRTVCFC